MRALIVIPARYGSTRFPGKPLALLGGMTVLQRVWNAAQRVCTECENCEAVVATEHPTGENESRKIVEYCHKHEIPVITTSESCKSGSDRAWEAATKIKVQPDIIINMQGDNPLCPPLFIKSVIDTFIKHPESPVVTPFIHLTWNALDELRLSKHTTPFSGTTVIISENGYARWFSKNIIPAIRNEKKLRENSALSPVCLHVGLYGYRYSALDFFAHTPASYYETLEGLEQLRFLENNVPVRMTQVAYPDGFYTMSPGIDSPEDLQRTEKLLMKYGELF